MKFEDCNIEMKVKVTEEYAGNKNVVGKIGNVVAKSHPQDSKVLVSFVNKVQGCWKGEHGKYCWYMPVSNLEPITDDKLTKSQIDRYQTSPHVQSRVSELKSKYGILDGVSNFLLSPNGSVLVYYEDSKGNFYSGTAKCHPDDKFDINVGLELAFQRLAKKLGCKPRWTPEEKEEFYRYEDTYEYISISFYSPSWFHDAIAVAIGNCFKTKEEACEHKDEIMERYKKLIAYAKTLNK